MKTIMVPPRQGRVCYVTEEKGVPHATVECSVEREAYRIPWTAGPVLVGDWVSFEGEARVEIVGRAGDVERYKRIPYYHDPYDGSDRSEWTYFDVRNPQKMRRLGPLEVREAVLEAQQVVQRLSTHWYSNDSRESLLDAIRKLEAAQAAIRKNLEDRGILAEDSAKAVAVSVQI